MVHYMKTYNPTYLHLYNKCNCLLCLKTGKFHLFLIFQGLVKYLLSEGPGRIKYAGYSESKF